ncbi:hypothetical protein AFCDBAGC_3687 [Methylobacterium cerastii]|uniref:DUF937 domain-containing protein n=1 Tax=Methylobacterium cerastii TaxID=932741 RepID=A0ABQ4QKM7_9HYPH|nr:MULTISPECIES: DUF937 domain-containing protein [Methylobacterium]TXN01222.1 hypothetical protein FV219_12445 [Methylobacterium sp. WL122]TXN80774.1 hypothetical protein FV234_15755 [Methylobacterium sp. WL8]GJD45810.1 hypothetical protein AFCDBAGC_3687 [Methylobacterium cerastii]
MFNPLDMLQAQNGAGMQNVAQQFGLTPEQTRRAMEALMPAFALGLQRSAMPDPTGLSQMFGMGGARPAASPAESMLGQMFGSPALTQAILQQASSASGVGSQVLRQMLPMMAGAVVASIVHMLLNQQAPEAKAAPAPAPSPFAVAPGWAEMMKAFVPAQEATKPQPARPQPAKPQAARAAPKPEADATPGMFEQMLKTGAEVQEQNVRAMQGLFEAFWTEADPAKAGATKAGADLKARHAPESPDASHRPRKGPPGAR